MFSLLLPALLAVAPPENTTQPPAIRELRYHLAVDSAVTGVGLAAWVGSETVLKKSLAPADCRWCDRLGDQDRLNRLDRAGRSLRWIGAEGTAGTVSDALAFAALPLGVLALQGAVAHQDRALAGVPVDVLVIAEAVVLTSVLNQTVKLLAGRERPFVHVLSPEAKASTHRPTDNNLSFFSGHTSFAFSMAVGAGTVAELRGYRHRAWVWAATLPLATAIPLLRMGADKHYLTDVLVGAAVGSALGWGVPVLFHSPQEDKPGPVTLNLAPLPNGAVLQGQF